MMKKTARVLVLAMLLSMVLVAFTACGNEFDGTWKATKVTSFGQEMSASDADMEYTLKIDGEKATLSYGDEAGEEGTVKETDEGITITFKDSTGDLEITGKMDGDNLILDFMGLAEVTMEKK